MDKTGSFVRAIEGLVNFKLSGVLYVKDTTYNHHFIFDVNIPNLYHAFNHMYFEIWMS